MTDLVRIERDGDVALITLNRPAAPTSRHAARP
jgi:hypothetical protein